MPDRSWLLIILIICDILIAYLTSLARGYVSSLTESKTEEDAENKVKNADKALKMLQNKQKYTISFSCVKTFCAIGFGMFLISYLIPLLKKHLSVSGETAGFFISCLFFLIFGMFYYVLFVSVPTKWGRKIVRRNSDVYSVYRLVHFISSFDYIISFLFCKISLLISREDEGEGNVIEDKILDLVGIGEETGNIESNEKEMIENVFDFSDIQASDLMTHRTDVIAVDIDMSDDDILSLINENEYSRYPVYNENIDNIIGILNSKKFYSNIISQNRKPLEDLLYTPFFVPESIYADDLLSEMRKRKNHMAVVIDEYGGTCGIITMEDLLEKIVGNIYDETDDPSSDEDIIQLSEKVYKIAGKAALSAVCEELSVSIPESDDYDTLGGLIFSFLTVIPTDGQLPVIDAFGLHISVLSMEDRRIEWAEVTLTDEIQNENE